MQNEIPYSLTVWQNANTLPFPPEVRELIEKVDWDEYEWHTAGLPVKLGKYMMLEGQSLYFSELPDGTPKVESLDGFTGNIFIAGFFLNPSPTEDSSNYFVSFAVTICKGQLVEVSLSECYPQSATQYKESIEEFNSNVLRIINISNSFWFKYLYRPWYLVVRGIAYALLFIMSYIKRAIVFCVKTLTPL